MSVFFHVVYNERARMQNSSLIYDHSKLDDCFIISSLFRNKGFRVVAYVNDFQYLKQMSVI